MTLTRPSVNVVVHHYLRWIRWSAAHSRREATARNGEFNERTLVDQISHESSRQFGLIPVNHHTMSCSAMPFTDIGSGVISMLHAIAPMLLIDQFFPFAPELVQLLFPRLPVRAILPQESR